MVVIYMIIIQGKIRAVYYFASFNVCVCVCVCVWFFILPLNRPMICDSMPSWQHMVYGCVWVCVGVYGCVWVCVGVYVIQMSKLIN